MSDPIAARDAFSGALEIAEGSFGSGDTRIGIAHLYLAMAPLIPAAAQSPGDGLAFSHPGMELVDGRYRAAGLVGAPDAPQIERTFGVLQECATHLDRAEEIFVEAQSDDTYFARIELMRAAIEADTPRNRTEARNNPAPRDYRNAIQHLIDAQYADEYIVRFALDWLARAREWTPHRRDTERNIAQVQEVLQFRREGPPVRILRAAPEYPRAAMVQGEGGAVLLSYFVNQDGRAVEVQIRRSAGDLLDAAALDAMSDFFFAPEMRNGTPVRSREMEFMFQFAVVNGRGTDGPVTVWNRHLPPQQH